MMNAPNNNENWPHAAYTRDKRVALVGGTKKKPALKRIKKDLRCAKALWVETAARAGLSAVKSLAESTRRGGIDLVIILMDRIGHQERRKVTNACDAAGVPWVVVPGGYGTSAIRRAIETLPTACPEAA